MTNVRKAAWETLLKINHGGAYSNLETKKVLKDDSIKVEDRRLYLNIVYGCLQNYTYLDYRIAENSDRALEKIHQEILEILRLSIYQLYFLDKVPDYAIVNEAVNLTVDIQPRAKGFVNAVLRNAMRKIEKDGKAFDFSQWRNEKEALSVRYSLPLWIVHKYYEAFGVSDAEAIIPMLTEKPPLTIRCNTLKTTRDQLQSDLEALGMQVSLGKISNQALHLDTLGSAVHRIEDLDLYRQGHFVVQDQATLLTVERLAPEPGQSVLDMCAAPGGKTTYLSQVMNNEGQVIARDVNVSRLDLVRQAMTRLGATNISVENQDGCVFNKDEAESYDKILLDAPCSGLGVIRRKPEIKYKITKKTRSTLVKLQEMLLENAYHYLKPGGELLYSTCTINKDENERQIENLTHKFSGLEVISDTKTGPYVYLNPLMDGCDGFFMCLLKK